MLLSLHQRRRRPLGGGAGRTQMSWDESLGIVVVRTPVWEASKEKARYFHPENLPQALCPPFTVSYQH